MNAPRRLLARALTAYGRLARGMTLGVRGMLLKDGRVLLVRHGYVPGWYLPGGGVEAGETALGALAREIQEETGAVLTGTPQLFWLYRQGGVDPNHHVALFVCRDWQEGGVPFVPNLEIAAAALFPLDCLPEDATPATRARLREVSSGSSPAADW